MRSIGTSIQVTNCLVYNILGKMCVMYHVSFLLRKYKNEEHVSGRVNRSSTAQTVTFQVFTRVVFITLILFFIEVGQSVQMLRLGCGFKMNKRETRIPRPSTNVPHEFPTQPLRKWRRFTAYFCLSLWKFTSQRIRQVLVRDTH